MAGETERARRELGEERRVSVSEAHYLWKWRMGGGGVKLDNFKRSGRKWGDAYLLTPMGIVEKAAITARFLVRKQREHTQLQQEIVELQEEVRQQHDLNNN